MHIMYLALAGLFSYLLGSLSFSIIVVRFFEGKDVRDYGSGNAGMTNVLRTFGKKAAIFTIIGDILKGTAAVLISRAAVAALAGPQYAVDAAYIAALCATLGHMFPVYFGFKGGKGISVAAGAVVAINPIIVMLVLPIFFIVFLATKMVSASSITVAACYPVATAVYAVYTKRGLMPDVLFACLIGVLIIFMHRANIKRILNGTEYKFGKKKQ